jgi:hypothetical protein
MPTLLQRVENLREQGHVDPEQYKVLRASARSARTGIYGLVSELNVTLSDLIGVKGDYIKCRALRHWWDDAEFNWTYRPMGEPEVMRCVRCEMIRIQVYGLNGKRNGNARYLPPDGYAFKGAGRTLTSADFDIVRRYLKLIEMVDAIEMSPETAMLERVVRADLIDN